MWQTAENTSELQFARDSIGAYIPIFKKHGYDYVGVKINQSSKLTADAAVFTFANRDTGMQISLAFTPPFRDLPRMFVVIIKNKLGHPFYVAEYLKTHGHTDLLKKFVDDSSTEPVARFWKAFFSALEHLFDTDLKDIIEGKRWEETPFDWGEYK